MKATPISHNTLAIISAACSLIGFIPYGLGILRGKVRPHLFTWLIWTFVTGLICFAQLVSGGGPGAWSTAVIALVCVICFVASIFRGEKTRTLFDWLCLILALFSITLWILSGTPLLSVILLTFIELLAFGLTVRKTLGDPYSESLLYFIVTIFKYFFAAMSLDIWSWETALYPVATGGMAILFTILIVICRLLKPQNRGEERKSCL